MTPGHHTLAEALGLMAKAEALIAKSLGLVGEEKYQGAARRAYHHASISRDGLATIVAAMVEEDLKGRSIIK